jgi:hypothetical protein
MKNNINANKIRTKLLLKINEEIPYFKNDKMLINSISLNELNKQYNDIEIYINDPLVYSIRKRTGNTSQIKKERSIETIDLDKKQKLSPINLNVKDNDNQIKFNKMLVSYKKNKHFKFTAICNGGEEKKENFENNYKSPKSDYSELIKDRKKKANLCKYSINFLRAMAKKFIDRTGKHLNKDEKIFYMTPPNNKLFNRQKYESQIDLFNIFSKLNEKELIEEQNHYITTDVIPSKVPLLIPPKLNLNKDIINEYNNNNEYEIENKKSIKKYKQTSSLKNKSKKNKVLFNLEDNETITINSPVVSFANEKKNKSMCSGVKSYHAKFNRNNYHQSLSSILTKPNICPTSKTQTNIFQNHKINKIKNSYKELYGDDEDEDEEDENIKYLNKSNKNVNEYKFYQDDDYSD